MLDLWENTLERDAGHWIARIECANSAEEARDLAEHACQSGHTLSQRTFLAVLLQGRNTAEHPSATLTLMRRYGVPLSEQIWTAFLTSTSDSLTHGDGREKGNSTAVLLSSFAEMTREGKGSPHSTLALGRYGVHESTSLHDARLVLAVLLEDVSLVRGVLMGGDGGGGGGSSADRHRRAVKRLHVEEQALRTAVSLCRRLGADEHIVTLEERAGVVKQAVESLRTKVAKNRPREEL